MRKLMIAAAVAALATPAVAQISNQGGLVNVDVTPELGDDAYFRLGNIHYKRMDRAEAVRLWRRALEVNPQNSVVRTNLELVERVL